MSKDNFVNSFLGDVTAHINEHEVDVVIVTYHTGPVLVDCINNVMNLANLNKIILVNNGNPVEVEKYLQQLQAENLQIKLISGHGNIGFAKACNLAAQSATAKFMLFLNPDCLISNPNLLTIFVSALIKSEQYQVATCLILNADGSIQKTCRRNLLTPAIAISESLSLYKISSRFKPLNLPVTEINKLPNISEVPALSGAVIFVMTDYYKQIGGFDEAYFLHVEDMDLCMNIHQRGDKILFINNVSVRHLLSTSTTTNKFLEYNKARGFIIFMRKFFPVFQRSIVAKILITLIWLRYFIKVYIFPKREQSN